MVTCGRCIFVSHCVARAQAYLFHGTKPSTVPVILKNGLDEHYRSVCQFASAFNARIAALSFHNVSNIFSRTSLCYSQDVGLFGRGLYLAAAASKSNQYCKPDLDKHPQNPHFGLYPMFVVRTCLGRWLPSLRVVL